MKNLMLLVTLTFLFSCKKDQVCPVNYTGKNCDQEVTPGRVRITRVQLTNYPATNGGQNWDVNSMWADPYFQIKDINNNVVFESAYLNDQQPASISQWDVDFVLTPPGIYIISFFDEDGNVDDEIESAVLQYYIPGKGFPDRYTFSGGLGSTSQISIFVKYEY